MHFTSYPFIEQHNMTNTPETQVALFNALIQFIAETKDIHADSVNPFHKSKYASLAKHLEVLKPLLNKHGLAILQFPCGYDKEVGVRTYVIHKSGGFICTDALIPCEAGMKGQDAGAIYSYIRRYAIASICGTATDDDDCELDRQIKSAPVAASKPKAPAPKVDTVTKGTGVFAAPASGDAVLVPFGDRKGQPLSSLPLVETDRSVKFGDLTYFAKRWTPKPFGDNPNPSARDLKVKAEAERLFAAATTGVEAEAPQSSDDVPF